MKEAVHISGVPAPGPDLQELLVRVARGDQDAFAGVYDAVSGPVLGLVRSVLRDPAQSEEVAQEVLVEVWRTAPRFRASRGSAMNWVLTVAHHRAVDRVRSAESAAAREHKAALLDRTPAFDEVSEQVESRLEREQVRRCMRTLSELQRESVTLAYYRGLTYREVSELLAVPLGTIKTRLRDGLIRLRDCLGGERMNTAELHTLTGAYALHALPDPERQAFERHLEDCEACTQEVRELSATAARLGLAVAETPPRELRERVLREIVTVRQETPAHGGRERTGGGGRTGRWYAYALAACVAAAAAFGGVAVWQNQVAQDARQEADLTQRQNEQLAQVLSAPDAKTTSAELTGGAHGTVVVSRSQNRAVFLASGMDRPPSGKVYQIWFNDEGTMRSAGLMDPKASDDAVLLNGPVDRASGMGITVEPAGGSAEPTSEPVALMDFPTA